MSAGRTATARLGLAAFRPAIAWRLALRELRGGISGFYIFLACIALGTAAIAAVNSVSRAITQAITEQGRDILAADIRFELNNREINAEERAFLDSLGTVSVSTSLRSILRRGDGADQVLVEVKAVDGLYPLYGAFRTQPATPAGQLLAGQGDAYGALAAPLLVERLGISPGDPLLLGNARLALAGEIEAEPDAIADGMALAPRLMVGREALSASGLIAAGSLVRHFYSVRLANPAERTTAVARARAEFPAAGWAIRTSERAAPGLSRNVERFSQFLTLVGLTALIIGGVGVANAVRAFLDGKRSTIATFKCLGAPHLLVTAVYLIQIMLIAALGVAIGLVVGAAAPLLALRFLEGVLPVPQGLAIYPSALLLAALFGLLTAFAFALPVLARTRNVAATALFRQQGLEGRGLPGWPWLVATGLALSALAGVAILTAEDRFIAAIFLASVAGAFLLLRLVAGLIAMAARRAPRIASAELRLAVGNIHRPGALTPSVVLSLGLGLALIVTLALIDGNLRRELTGNIARNAPNFFFVDIQQNERDGFVEAVRRHSPQGVIQQEPMLRGRILALNGTDVGKLDVPADARWVLQGDRGITYEDNVPENSTLTEGEWWPQGYDGEPLVSFATEQAQELGLKIGDTVTVNVLGRNLTARIANFRTVEWESLSINFIMVFSPNSFAGAPHAWLATLSDTALDTAAEAAILRDVTNAFPTITSIRIKDAIEAVDRLAGQLAGAIRAAAGVALAASVLVLAGALAAGNRARARDAVVLKTLGATRPALIRAFAYEYLILGSATALFALLAGAISAWFVLDRVMGIRAAFLPDVAFATLLLSLAVTLAIGLAGTWAILGRKPAGMLREL